MKTLLDVLSKKSLHFNFVSPDSKVIDAIALMKIEDMSYVVVMQDHNYLGVLTERDYTQKVILQNRNSSATMVKEIMNTDLPVVTVNDSCEKSMEIMNTFKVRYLPVFDGYTFKGVITINDLLEASVEENETAKKSGINKNESDSSSNTIQHYWI